MIKGVNRQVLEIHDTGVDCFEKALFFVKPEFSTMSEQTLQEKAKSAFSMPASVPKTKRGKLKFVLARIAMFIAAAGSGALITLFIK